MEFHIITLFPEYFDSPLKTSLLGKAVEENIVKVSLHYLRKFSTDKHKNVDDRPFGGGAGMILKPQPLFDALEYVKKKAPKKTPVVYFTPRGQKLTQKKVDRFSQYQSLILLCGRYEGVDQRVIDTFVDYEISLGDYILAGGEAAAMTFIEAVTRYIPGVLGNFDSVKEESFSEKLEGKKEYPLYTQPREFKGLKVPDVLFSGNHKAIEEWKKKNCK
jgi:tRNA (guanine37-N1)-methyltransferase